MDDLLSAIEISRRLKIHHATVCEIAKKHNLQIVKDGYHHIKYSLSEIEKSLSIGQPNQYSKGFDDLPSTKTYNDYWKLPWDEFIVGADIHSPYFYLPIIERLLEVREKYKIKKIILAGDTWNQDSFSTWWVAKEDLVKFDEEVEASKKIVNLLTDNFDDVRFFLGSHDIRFWRLLYSQGKFESYDTIWNLLENKKIKVSPYRYCEINDEFRVNHPKNVVKVGGLPAIRMGAKFNRSVIFGHGHWQGYTWDPSGKHMLMAPGCLCDPQKIAYKCTWDTSHDEWIPGFILVRDRVRATIMNEKSDWDLILRK
jgi:predicted phosphodiesterase